jgi:hypothetical protein
VNVPVGTVPVETILQEQSDRENVLEYNPEWYTLRINPIEEEEKVTYPSLRQFIFRNRIKIAKITPIRKNPDTALDGPVFDMDSWKVTLVRPKNRSTKIFISKSFSARGARPSCSEIFYRLGRDLYPLSKVASAEEWARANGYRTHSSVGKQKYALLLKRALAMQAFLGEKGYDQLIAGSRYWYL